MSFFVGIDLGTTNSCVAVFKENRVQIIENKKAERTTPSFVYYDDRDISVGKDAVNRAAINPKNGIFDIKRLIGRQLMPLKKHETWPFKVILKEDASLFIIIDRDGVKLELTPEEVYAEILKQLKKDAENFLKQPIENVVITVPAYFSDSQKVATEVAAKIAGLNVLKLINEPTAAALAYTQEAEENLSGCTVLIYDLGGGTFDVSIMKFQKRGGTVLAIGGDRKLGGRDFDDNLVKYVLSEIGTRYQYSVVEQKSNTKRHGIRRIREKCEEIKKELSSAEEATLALDAFFGVDVEIKVTRQKFEELNKDLFEKTIEIVDDVTKQKIKKSEINEVILVGGSTRIPRIQKLVQDFFNGKQLNKRVNPDEAVAIGAALQAASLSTNPLQQIGSMFALQDVTPFSIGIQVEGNTMNVLIKKNTKIPARALKKYKTIEDNQTEVDLCFFEGENKFVKDNIPLGELNISGITPKKKGQVEVILAVHLDINGVLNATATETSQRTPRHLSIELKKARLTYEDIIKRMGALRFGR